MLQHNKGTVLTTLDSPDKTLGQETSWTLVYIKEQQLLGQRWEQQTKICPRSAGTEQLTQGAELKKGKDSPGSLPPTHIELDDPQQGDEEQVEGDEEAECPPHI